MDDFKNFAYSHVAIPPTPADTGTELTLVPGEGELMPDAPFNGVVWPAGVMAIKSNAEIVRVTLRVNDTLTFQRIQEYSNPRAILAGDQFAAPLTAKMIADLLSVAGTLEQAIPVGVVDGVRVLFTTPVAFLTGTLAVWLNGLRLSPGLDFVESSTSSFTLVDAPLVGDVLLVTYTR